MGLSNVMTVSLSKKTILGSSFLGIFTGRSCEMTLFISLSWASFRDFSILLAINPPKIVLSLLQEVYYLLLLDLYLYHPFIGIYGAPFFDILL